MKKIEFYNAMVDVYQKTGQGVPYFLKNRLPNPRIVDDLIKDGLVKIVTTHYSTLPDDKTLCLTKGYCVEEDISNRDSQALSYIRMYLDIDPIISLGSIQLSIDDAKNNPDFMDGYNEWLAENKDKLDEMKNVTHLKDGDISEFKAEDLSEEESDYLKTRFWYKKNKTINECLMNLNEGNNDIEKLLKNYKQMIDLKYSSKSENHLKTVKKDEEEFSKLKKEQEIRSKIELFLLSIEDKSELIQNIIN